MCVEYVGRRHESFSSPFLHSGHPAFTQKKFRNMHILTFAATFTGFESYVFLFATVDAMLFVMLEYQDGSVFLY